MTADWAKIESNFTVFLSTFSQKTFVPQYFLLKQFLVYLTQNKDLLISLQYREVSINKYLFDEVIFNGHELLFLFLKMITQITKTITEWNP